jgi:sialic acid synthase SpsE/protoporphyrinogen oxidase
MANKIIIIGAGPSGLIAGYNFLLRGFDVQIFEQSNMTGGMCRSWKVGDYILDTGPHIYHTPDKSLEKEWRSLFGELLIEGEFWSKNVRGENLSDLVDYPLSWETIGQFPNDIKNSILEELKYCNQLKSKGATNFKEYVEGLVGKTLASLYFERYPKKVWGVPTTSLTPDWAPKRIEIREKITPFYTGQFAAVGKYGTGCIYDELSKRIVDMGGQIFLDRRVTGLEFNDSSITVVKTENYSIQIQAGDIVVSTIPITTLGKFLGVQSSLSFRGIASVYIGIDSAKIVWPEKVHWLYFDSENLVFNRITNNTMLSAEVSPLGVTLITCEITYSRADMIDTLSGEELVGLVVKDLEKTNMLEPQDIIFSSFNKEPFVYPIQEPNYQKELAQLKSRIQSKKNLYSIGTGGDFFYADSQVIFNKAYDLVDIVTGKDSTLNQVNKVNSYFKFNNVVELGREQLKVGNNYEPQIIGEIGLNHNGNINLAYQLIDKAVEVGLKFVKIQTYTSGNSRVSSKVKSANYVEKITNQEETLDEIFDKYNLSQSEQIAIFQYARERGLTIFSTPFDIESAIFLNEHLHVDCFKIASVDLVNLPLIDLVSSFGKPMILSCGMSNLSEIEDALSVIRSNQNENVILLHCNSSYPAPEEEMNLEVINTLKQAFKVPVGLSDHTFGLFTSIVAMSIGASLVERHFTLDRFMDGPDHILSSEPSEMLELVSKAKLIPIIKGDGIKRIEGGEYFNLNLQRKCLYFSTDLKAGTKLTKDSLVVKGPGGGILPKYLSVLLGKTLLKDVEKDSPLTWDAF